MYIKRIKLTNVGPIVNLDYHFPFTEDGKPKPVIIVGSNGTGKSIFISYIINALISAKQVIYDNSSEVEQGKVYKYQSSRYIHNGADYYRASLEFEGGFEVVEWQLHLPRGEFEEELKYTPIDKEWQNIDINSVSYFNNSYKDKNELKELINNNCILYFPANRFEEPAWLNYDNLISKAAYTYYKNITGITERVMIQYSPLQDNQNWILDLVLDQLLHEKIIFQPPNNQNEGHPPFFLGYSGECTNLFFAIKNLLREIFRVDGSVSISVHNRKRRAVSLTLDNGMSIQNLFQLSTGQAITLNLFLSILRDFDMTNNEYNSLNDVSGIVVIDELDLHLHSDLQYETIPRLIKLFPKVQFVFTSHSPILILGMQSVFGDDGISILELPSGNMINAERFNEFLKAYEYLKATIKFENDIENAILSSKMTVVFVEGEYDIQYILKAAELLARESVLTKIKLCNGEGFGNLNKIWNKFESRLSEYLPNKILLLYDCDVSVRDADNSMIFKRIIPTITLSKITKGIENLFPTQTIERVMAYNDNYIDIIKEGERRVRGIRETIPEKIEVNTDEKGNMCKWLCENGTVDDFINFHCILDIIDSIETD